MMSGLKDHRFFTLLKPIASIWLCYTIVIAICVSSNDCFANEKGWTQLPDRITLVPNHGKSVSGHHVRAARSAQDHDISLMHPTQSIGFYEPPGFIYGSLKGNGGRTKRNININILSNLPLGDIIRANAGQPSSQVRRSTRKDPRFPR